MRTIDNIDVINKTINLDIQTTWEEDYEMQEFADEDPPVAELSSCISTNHGSDVVFVRLSGENAESNLAF